MRDFAHMPDPRIKPEPRPAVALAWLQKIVQELGLDPRDVNCVIFDAATFHVHHRVRDQHGHLVKRDGKSVEDVTDFAVIDQPNLMASRTRPVRGGQDAPGDRPASRMSLEHSFPGTRELGEAPETAYGPHSRPSRA